MNINRFFLAVTVVTIIFFTVVFCSVFAASKATKPYNFTSHTTALSDQVNKDMDSIYVPFNKAVDTLNSMPRWNSLLRGDSIFGRIKVDTISSNPVVDSLQGVDKIRGNPDIDSINGMNCIRGNPNIDSISGKTIFSDTIKIMAPVLFGSTAGLMYNIGSQLNFRNDANSNSVGYLNYNGYQGGTTQYRDLDIGNGKHGTILFVDGSDSSVMVPKLKVDSIKFSNNTNYLIGCIDTSFACSLFDNTTYRATATARAFIIGKSITLYLPQLTGNISSDSFCYIHIPTKFIPTTTLPTFAIRIVDAGVNSIGKISIYNTPVVGTGASENLSGGTGGILPVCINYLLD
jgi:hypothetical protein